MSCRRPGLPAALQANNEQGGTGSAGNIRGSEASAIKGKIAPYAIVTINGEKIGIVGSTTPDLLTKTSPNGTVVADDGNPATDKIQEAAAFLQNAVDALTTLGVLARAEHELAKFVQKVQHWTPPIGAATAASWIAAANAASAALHAQEL